MQSPAHAGLLLYLIVPRATFLIARFRFSPSEVPSPRRYLSLLRADESAGACHSEQSEESPESGGEIGRVTAARRVKSPDQIGTNRKGRIRRSAAATR